MLVRLYPGPPKRRIVAISDEGAIVREFSPADPVPMTFEGFKNHTGVPCDCQEKDSAECDCEAE